MAGRLMAILMWLVFVAGVTGILAYLEWRASC
jgi:hypothetical protein